MSIFMCHIILKTIYNYIILDIQNSSSQNLTINDAKTSKIISNKISLYCSAKCQSLRESFALHLIKIVLPFQDLTSGRISENKGGKEGRNGEIRSDRG